MIQVRRKRYRGRDGWHVCGYPTADRTGWPVGIFTLHESTARAIARRIKTGEGPAVDELLLSEDWT